LHLKDQCSSASPEGHPNSNQNEAQLITLICDNLVTHKDAFVKHILIITARDSLPLDVDIKRQDMATTKEEGDTFKVQAISVKANAALVVADDTDISAAFLLTWSHFKTCFDGFTYPRMSDD